MSENVLINSSFVSEKISKIRFCPEQFNEANAFVTGSWDAKNNSVKLWRLIHNEFAEEENEYTPKRTDQLSFGGGGSVTGLELIDHNNLAVGLSDGSLRLIYLNRDREENQLKENVRKEGLHDGPCTGVSVFKEDVVTVGEDGTFNVFSTATNQILRANKAADSCAIACVSFVDHKELLTGNSLGVIKIFDLNTADDRHAALLSVSCEDDKRCNGVTSICYHPTQNHIVLAGTEEGSVTVFDLRRPDRPASYLSAHADAICEIAFHYTEPSKLFTCSEGGELWLWNQQTFPAVGLAYDRAVEGTETAWLNGERAKNSVTVVSLMAGGAQRSINSFDSWRRRIVSAGDNETIHLLEHVY